jgi:hypothetical protein
MGGKRVTGRDIVRCNGERRLGLVRARCGDIRKTGLN